MSALKIRNALNEWEEVPMLKGDTGDSGVHVGAEAPTDENKNVWIDIDDDSMIEFPTITSEDNGKVLTAYNGRLVLSDGDSTNVQIVDFTIDSSDKSKMETIRCSVDNDEINEMLKNSVVVGRLIDDRDGMNFRTLYGIVVFDLGGYSITFHSHLNNYVFNTGDSTTIWNNADGGNNSLQIVQIRNDNNNPNEISTCTGSLDYDKIVNLLYMHLVVGVYSNKANSYMFGFISKNADGQLCWYNPESYIKLYCSSGTTWSAQSES